MAFLFGFGAERMFDLGERGSTAASTAAMEGRGMAAAALEQHRNNLTNCAIARLDWNRLGSIS